jgi:hypothetical protein
VSVGVVGEMRHGHSGESRRGDSEKRLHVDHGAGALALKDLQRLAMHFSWLLYKSFGKSTVVRIKGWGI